MAQTTYGYRADDTMTVRSLRYDNDLLRQFIRAWKLPGLWKVSHLNEQFASTRYAHAGASHGYVVLHPESTDFLYVWYYRGTFDYAYVEHFRKGKMLHRETVHKRFLTKAVRACFVLMDQAG
jgi:hypothetical protein